MDTMEIITTETAPDQEAHRAYADALAEALGWEVAQVRIREIELVAPNTDAHVSIWVWLHNDTYRIGTINYCRPYIQAKRLTRDVLARVRVIADQEITRYLARQQENQERLDAHNQDLATLNTILEAVTRLEPEIFTDWCSRAYLTGDGFRVTVDTTQGWSHNSVEISLAGITVEQAQAVVRALAL